MLVTSSCGKINTATIAYENLTFFDRVELNDSFEVHLIEGNTFSVRIEGDEGVIDKVKYSISDSVLVLSNSRRFKWVSPTKNKIKVYITAQPLKLLAAFETCYITTDTPITSEEFGLELHSKANEANLELNGNVFYYWNNFQCGGKLTLSGKTQTLKLWNFAVLVVDAGDLIADYAIVENSSKGDCIVNVKDRLDYAIKGDGNINLYGSPSEINQITTTESLGKLVQY